MEILNDMFGSKLEKSMIVEVFRSNQGHIEKSINALLHISAGIKTPENKKTVELDVSPPLQSCNSNMPKINTPYKVRKTSSSPKVKDDNSSVELLSLDHEDGNESITDFNVAKELQENDDYFLALKYYNEAPTYQPPILNTQFLIEGLDTEYSFGMDEEKINEGGDSEEVDDDTGNQVMTYIMSDNLDNYEANLALAEIIGDVGSGLSQDDLIKLPSFVYQNQLIEEKNCSICLGEWEKEQNLKRLSCLHCFHQECVDHWLSKKNSCPLCLTEVKL